VSITDETGAALGGEYDDWFDRGYLRGLDHGRFHQAPELAARIEAAPPELDLRFRGEHLTVHTTGGTAYAVLWEEWFGKDASTWVRHASPAAAHAWAHQVAAQWLRNETGYRSGGGTLQSWGRLPWAAERDLVHGRWHVAVGLFPGVTYASTETEDPEEGWAFLTGTLTAAGFPADTWPAAMRQVRDEDLPDPEPEALPVAAAAPASTPEPERTTWRTRLRQLLARLLASLRQTR
jgi:hypothetical protein